MIQSTLMLTIEIVHVFCDAVYFYGYKILNFYAMFNVAASIPNNLRNQYL
jgi:hypothetical protein